MPNIKPWCWPVDYVCDRVMYIPTRPAHILEYQEELIDAEGNIYWKTVDTTAASGSSSMNQFQEQMKDYYESRSLERIKHSFDNPEYYE